MPDFRGLSIRRAVDLAHMSRVNLRLAGTGTAALQSVPAGARVLPDTPVTVEFWPVTAGLGGRDAEEP